MYQTKDPDAGNSEHGLSPLHMTSRMLVRWRTISGQEVEGWMGPTGRCLSITKNLHIDL